MIFRYPTSESHTHTNTRTDENLNTPQTSSVARYSIQTIINYRIPIATLESRLVLSRSAAGIIIFDALSHHD